jgi:hypothetical protein
MSRLRYVGAGLFAAAVLVRLGFALLTGYTADDAFITFRYAENLAWGNGFVYNIGERVLGTSTPLFTFLLAITTVLQIPVTWAALGISLAASGMIAVFLYRFARALRLTHLAILPSLLYIAWLRSIPADISGMETALFTFLVTAAFYYQHRRLAIYALGMATLASVTRPEGLGLLGLLLLYNLYRDRTLWRSYLATPLILLGPWLLFAWLYFGSPVPNSMIAKLALYSQFGTMPPLDALVYLLGLGSLVGWLLLTLLLIGAWELNRAQNSGQLELVWIVAMLLFFSLSRTHLFHWYITPIYPIFFLFVAAAINLIYQRMRIPVAQAGRIGTALSLAILLALLFFSYRQVDYYRETQQTTERVHREIGTWLFAQTEASSVIAAEDIGYIGYYSKRTILDRDGLVSQQAVEFNRDGRYLELITERHPEYVVAMVGSPISGFIYDPGFTSYYRELKRFGYRTIEYRIYQRAI